MSKNFDLSVMGIGNVVTASNLYGSEVDRFNGLVSSEVLAQHLAAITTTDKTTDALGIAKAYHAAMVTKTDAKNEGFKSEAELIMKMTGLGKASVSVLRKVGEMFIGENGEFTVPEELRGFTVTQIYEVLSKSKAELTPQNFALIADECEITTTTSAKDIREKMKDRFSGTTKEEREASNKAKAVKAARAKLEKDGYTAPIYLGGEEIGAVAILSIDNTKLTEEQLEKLQNHKIMIAVDFVD